MSNKFKYKQWIEAVERLRGDTDHRDGKLKLDRNERISPFSDGFWKQVVDRISQETILTYPDVSGVSEKLAKHLGVPVTNLMLTAGSDAGIRTTFDLCVGPGEGVVYLDPTFAMVDVYCGLSGANKKPIGYGDNFSLDADQIVEAIDNETALVVLANPNSPTGTALNRSDIEAVVKKAAECEGLVLVDEAYHEFLGETAIDLISSYSNLVIARTFSKAFGLAGLRIGCLVASESTIELLYKFRPMYEVNAVSLIFLEALIENHKEVTGYIKEIEEGKQYLEEKMTELGYACLPTKANFIHIDFQDKQEAVYQALEKNNVLVRKSPSNLSTSLRITLGPKEIMKQVVEITEKIS